MLKALIFFVLFLPTTLMLSQSAETSQNTESSWKHLPGDLRSDIVHEINLEDDSIPDIVTFGSVCTQWRSLSDAYFQSFCEKENCFPWAYCTISPLLLLHLNEDFLRMLTMHKNIKHYPTETNGVDDVYFARFCQKIQRTPGLEKDSLIVSFARLLEEDLYCSTRTGYQLRIDNCSFSVSTNRLHKLKEKVGRMLGSLRNQSNPSFQNETVLYFYFIEFINGNKSIRALQYDDFYDQIKCNLFKVIQQHDQLATIRSIKSSDRSESHWKKILELDCFPPVFDYRQIGILLSNLGKHGEALTHFHHFKDRLHQSNLSIKPLELSILTWISYTYYHVQNYEKAAYYYDDLFSMDESLINKHAPLTQQILYTRQALDAHNQLGNSEKVLTYQNQLSKLQQTLAQTQTKTRLEFLLTEFHKHPYLYSFLGSVIMTLVFSFVLGVWTLF